jgi:hypothetical protein
MVNPTDGTGENNRNGHLKETGIKRNQKEKCTGEITR